MPNKTGLFLRDCLRIRLVEEKIIELYPSDLIQSPVHLSIGQESVAVGVVGALRPADLVFPNYRGHAYYLAKGGPMELFFAELMGRQRGISKGKAGSMHLAAPDQGLMGASAVVASTISHAVGAALAERIKPDGDPERVFVSIFGDGATEQGGFFESLNFASIHKLPVLFLCEDNGLAVHTDLKDRQSFTLERIAQAFNVGYSRLEEGYEPTLVHKSASQCVNQMRQGSGPVILHIKTMRYMEHVGPGEDFIAGYREEAEVNKWKALDPIFEYQASSPKVVQAFRDEIEKAVVFATESPFPTKEELLTDVL